MDYRKQIEKENKEIIKEPKSIDQILRIDQWSRRIIYKKILTKKNV